MFLIGLVKRVRHYSDKAEVLLNFTGFMFYKKLLVINTYNK